MLGKFVSNKQANIRKGKGRQKKSKRNPTKKKAIKTNRKNINSLGQAFSGNKIDKKPLKMQEKTIWGYCVQTRSTETQRNQKNKTTKTPKKDQKKTFFHSDKPPLFLFFLLSHVCKAVFC